jgi:cell division protein FtsB
MFDWAQFKAKVNTAKSEMRLVDFMLLAALCALQYPLWFGTGSWLNVGELHHKLESKEVVLKKLETRNDHLEAKVVSLQSGDRAVEELARRHLGMVSKGEIFIWVIPATENS